MRKFAIQEATTAFRLFVNWSVRFLIVGGHRSEAVEIPFSKAALAIETGTITTGPQMAKELSACVPGDEDFKNAFAIATSSRPELSRYYLRAIEDSFAQSPHPEWISQPNAEKVNLEHVLPVNPSAGWGIKKEEDAEELHNRIGNLALLPKGVNREIGNSTFAEKKPAFVGCSYQFTCWIAQHDKWGSRVPLRQSLLAGRRVDFRGYPASTMTFRPREKPRDRSSAMNLPPHHVPRGRSLSPIES